MNLSSYLCELMQLALMELHFCWMETPPVRVGWRSATTTLMVLCVMTSGMTWMLKLSAGTLDFWEVST